MTCSSFALCRKQRKRRQPGLTKARIACAFEEALKRLETIVEAMESDDLPLETLLARFEEGTRLAKNLPGEAGGGGIEDSTAREERRGEMTLKPARRIRSEENTMSRYLDMVDNPSHVKKLTLDAAPATCGGDPAGADHEALSKNGGHLGPNLGVVELTIALHRVSRHPQDKFVWDVSHQSYVHKLLTGRKDRFHTIRTTGGLNGFALRTESEHDCYGAGHAGTALSAALGMAAARDQRGSNENVVAIFGDAALTNGISFEALNNIAHTTKRFIGILNDNEWSIAKNVGAIASYLNKLITHPRYNRLQKDFERLVNGVPKGESR